MTSHNIYTLFWASPPPFLGYDARITPSKTRLICSKIEHIYYKNNFEHLPKLIFFLFFNFQFSIFLPNFVR